MRQPPSRPPPTRRPTTLATIMTWMSIFACRHNGETSYTLAPPVERHERTIEIPAEPPSREPTVASSFPTSEEVDDILAILPGRPPSSTDIASTASLTKWIVDRGVPKTTGQRSPTNEQRTNAATRTLLGHIQNYGRHSKITEGMSCVSKEVGRYVATTGALPDALLSNLVQARCGAVATKTLFFTWKIDPESAVPEQLRKHLKRPPVELGHGLPGGLLAGAWYDSKSSLLTLAFGQNSLDIAPMPMVPNEDRVTIEIRRAFADDEFDALVSTDAGLPMECRGARASTSYLLSCPVSGGVSAVYVELVWKRMGHPAGHQMLFFSPNGTLPRTILMPEITLGETLVDEIALLEAINDARGDEGLPPFSIAEDQNAENRRLASPLRSSSTHPDHEVEHTRLSARIQAGARLGSTFTDSVVLLLDAANLKSSASSIVARWMVSPYVRRILLDPEASLASLGLEVSPDGSGSIVFSSYTQPTTGFEMFVRSNILDEAARIRRNKRLSKPEVLREPRLNALLDQVERRLRTGSDPRAEIRRITDKMEDLLSSEAKNARGGGVRMTALYSGINEDGNVTLRWPDEILESSSMRMTTRVGWREVPRSNMVRPYALIACIGTLE